MFALHSRFLFVCYFGVCLGFLLATSSLNCGQTLLIHRPTSVRKREREKEGKWKPENKCRNFVRKYAQTEKQERKKSFSITCENVIERKKKKEKLNQKAVKLDKLNIAWKFASFSYILKIIAWKKSSLCKINAKIIIKFE